MVTARTVAVTSAGQEMVAIDSLYMVNVQSSNFPYLPGSFFFIGVLGLIGMLGESVPPCSIACGVAIIYKKNTLARSSSKEMVEITETSKNNITTINLYRNYLKNLTYFVHVHIVTACPL
jgi:hypothetical protein